MMLIKGYCLYCKDWRIVAEVPRCYVCHGKLIDTKDVPS